MVGLLLTPLLSVQIEIERPKFGRLRDPYFLLSICIMSRKWENFYLSANSRTPLFTFSDHLGQVRNRANLEGARLHTRMLRH